MFNEIVTEKIENIKDLERKIYQSMCKRACEIMKTMLEEIDNQILQEKDNSIYRNKGFRTTCLKTIMGDVIFKRRIYIELKTRKNSTSFR